MRVKEVFLAALERENPVERAAYVNEACGTKESLRRLVEALLREHKEAGSFLEEPAADLAAAAGVELEAAAEPTHDGHALTEGPGNRINQIGEGGIGSVCMTPAAEPSSPCSSASIPADP